MSLRKPTNNPILAFGPYTNLVTYTSLEDPAITTAHLREALHWLANDMMIHLETHSHRLGHRYVTIYGAAENDGSPMARCAFRVLDESDRAAAEYNARWTAYCFTSTSQEASSRLTDIVLRTLLVQLCKDARDVRLWDELHPRDRRSSSDGLQREVRRARRRTERSRQNGVAVVSRRSTMTLPIRLRGREDGSHSLFSAARRREQRGTEILHRREMRLPFRPRETPSSQQGGGEAVGRGANETQA